MNDSRELLAPQKAPATRRQFVRAAVSLAAGPVIGCTNSATVAAGRWLGGIVITWAIEKVLESIWEGSAREYLVNYATKDRDASFTPAGVRAYPQGHSVGCRFGEGCAHFSTNDGNFRLFPKELMTAFDVHRIDAHDMFMNWGAPTSRADGRATADGWLGGLAFGQLTQRYVVYRTFNDGRPTVFLPCVNRSGREYYRIARSAVVTGNLSGAGERLRALVVSPSNFRFQASDRPEYIKG